MRRIWALRQFPIFAGAALGDLALLAENVVDATFGPGEVVAAPGRLESLHLIVDGEIATGETRWAARDAFGLLELLAGHPLTVPAVAMRPTRTLELFAHDLGDLLEEGFGVLRGALHELASRVVLHAAPPPGAIAIPDEDPLGLVDRLIVLRQLPPFASARLDAVSALAHAAEEAVFGPGAVLARAGERAAAAHVVLAGEVRATSRDRHPFSLTAGSTLGGVEVLGALAHARTFEAGTRVRTLAFGAQALFDVIEEHAELGVAVLASLASALLSASARS